MAVVGDVFSTEAALFEERLVKAQTFLAAHKSALLFEPDAYTGYFIITKVALYPLWLGFSSWRTLTGDVSLNVSNTIIGDWSFLVRGNFEKFCTKSFEDVGLM